MNPVLLICALVVSFCAGYFLAVFLAAQRAAVDEDELNRFDMALEARIREVVTEMTGAV